MEKFIEQLKSLAKRVEVLKDSIETEEATKTAIVMPFFQLLGYDIFNPLEFNPEFTADVGIKKGEKVDYAILHDGQPVILIECKSINQQLTRHDSQLFRYFGTTTAKFSILTNGIEYKFFTDLEEPNKMDSSPFFTFKINELRDVHISEIAKFRKESFDVDKITSNASELKYLNALKSYLGEQFENPSEDFVRFMVGEIYEGVKTKAAIEKFTPIIKRGLKQIVNEQVNDKLNAALKSTNENKISIEEAAAAEVIEDDGIITTQEELECYAIVKVILKDSIEINRVFYRDNRSYFNILIDDNIRKWVIRVFFEKNKNFIILNDAATDKERTLIEFDQPIDLLISKDKIINTALQFS
ncbi:type I restriction endonuclease [Sporosarcina sp. Te-1]|uniref:type I restriction endonuclease n=1 Tax=Sporosarcina sp. Te-1 TaxID=2818390 RepID=UPI001A9E9059|nr:type I restriction endonuclease [Sporosarcina sp. Te-1]QTD40598.1 type I restriction enzyme HsdR N-terminal domain-containing protein [Sporosarcina sp. Te-1]